MGDISFSAIIGLALGIGGVVCMTIAGIEARETPGVMGFFMIVGGLFIVFMRGGPNA